MFLIVYSKVYVQKRLKNIRAELQQPADERVYSGDETFIIKIDRFITNIW
jgi:hypothetical protein